MAFADWLLPLLLLTSDDEHGRVPFEWPVPVAPTPAPVMTVVAPVAAA